MGSSAAAAAAAAAAADSAQWLSVKEETIFLHDGLIRVTDLAELPSEILGAPEAADTDLEVSEAARPAPAPAVRLAHPPGSPGVRLSPLRRTPTPRPPKAAPAGVCGRGAGRWGLAAAGLPIARLPPSLEPNARWGFHLWFHFERSDTRRFIRLSPRTAFTPWRSHCRLPSPLSLPPGPPDSLPGHTQVA